MSKLSTITISVNQNVLHNRFVPQPNVHRTICSITRKKSNYISIEAINHIGIRIS